ncbi:MAG: glycosyltransferase family 4 protein [Deltaproteobacteria bacterium]|nr:glycosyltransferase family 4 protein [Deltaproteobacteria bacterium]MBL7217713.1 glycosyltransferase family 4 protein [Desulfobacteraceae bacterium]
MINRILAVSNHGVMLGGGEYSFLDLLSHLPHIWKPLALVPHEGELKAGLRENGIETQVIPLPSIRPWFIHNMLTCLRSYFIICKKEHPDLIYANGSRAAFYGGLVGNLLGLPVVWHCRIADSDPYLDLFLVSLSTCIVTNSRATARRFKTRIRQKVRVVYNGVNIRWLQNESIRKPEMMQDDWKVILIVARVSRWKRHDLALSAFEHVAKSDPFTHLVCIGAEDQFEPEWWNYLQERSRFSEFSERIHWVGQVDDVRPWYRAAELLVLPSENEPFGRVLVEAMASGLPVVATRSGGVPEIVRHNQDGILVSPGSVQELIKVIKELLEDGQLRRRLAESGKERAQVFSLDAHVSEMVKIFEEAKYSGSLRELM